MQQGPWQRRMASALLCMRKETEVHRIRGGKLEKPRQGLRRWQGTDWDTGLNSGIKEQVGAVLQGWEKIQVGTKGCGKATFVGWAEWSPESFVCGSWPAVTS